MKLSKTVSLQPATLEIIEKSMKRNNLKEVSIALEQLILAGAEAENEKERVNSK